MIEKYHPKAQRLEQAQCPSSVRAFLSSIPSIKGNNSSNHKRVLVPGVLAPICHASTPGTTGRRTPSLGPLEQLISNLPQNNIKLFQGWVCSFLWRLQNSIPSIIEKGTYTKSTVQLLKYKLAKESYFPCLIQLTSPLESGTQFLQILTFAAAAGTRSEHEIQIA